MSLHDQFKGRFWFRRAFELWKTEEKKKIEVAGGRAKNNGGTKVETFKVDDVAVNFHLWGILERMDGTFVPPEVYKSVKDVVYAALDELYEDGKLDPLLIPGKLTVANYRTIQPKFDLDFPEVNYCSAAWKIKHFFQIWMPSWKSTRKLGGKPKQVSNSTKPGEHLLLLLLSQITPLPPCQ